MRWRYVLGGVTVVTVLGLASGLAVVGVQNREKPAQISRLQQEIEDQIYPTIPIESRKLTKIGPAYPSPGYEN